MMGTTHGDTTPWRSHVNVAASGQAQDELIPPDAADAGALEYLRLTCSLLWPAPNVVTLEGRGWRRPRVGSRSRSQRPGWRDGEYALVPGLGRPPLLVPASGHIAASAIRHFNGQRTLKVRLTTKVLSLCLTSGLGGTIYSGRFRASTPPGSESIETYLGRILSRDIRVSMSVGPPRANRKPILQLLGKNGEALAFVKVGATGLTRDLVRTEHAALADLGQSQLRRVTTPEVLHYGEWNGLRIVVLSPLPVWRQRRGMDAAELAAAMNEVAQLNGLQSRPLRDSSYLRKLRDRITALEQAPERAALLQAVDLLTSGHGDTVLPFGAWHGDWSPWNMASTDPDLLVWDWERFAADVPLGFDALHYRLQSEVGPGHVAPRAAAATSSAQAPQTLAPFGITTEQARITSALYLTDLATRYLADKQEEFGARNGAAGTWLIPAIATAAQSAGSA
jgi:Phosphotransferase enzyme family